MNEIGTLLAMTALSLSAISIALTTLWRQRRMKNNEFHSINGRIDVVYTRIDTMNTKIDDVKKSLHKRIDDIDNELSDIRERVAKVEQDTTWLKNNRRG